MGQVTIRNTRKARGWFAVSPYNGIYGPYEIATINLGSNPISKIEVVSALNSFNLGWDHYHYNPSNCTEKYNPKVYLSALQTVSITWNYDQNSGLKSELRDQQKSGSWPFKEY